ncbi:MAG: M56 family metallopeptidase [Chitinophagaceae bacterium]|nr:M56 family metallopeptidase [Chitinophagaceae bacterium]MBA4167796.1 M56 family metallopeptidase [Chitinophagaceae bacterium]
MASFYQSALMEALGWSLADSFWKMGSLWIIYIVVTGNGKSLSAKARYTLALLLMSAGTVWSFASVNSYYHNIISGKEISTLAVFFKNDLAGLVSAENLMSFISAGYLLMLGFFSCKFFYRFYTGKKVLNKDLTEAGEQIKQIVKKLSERIAIRKNISIFFSATIETPLTAGFIKPMIVLPIAIVNQLSIQQTESILAHELFHITRNDYLVNIIVSFAGITLFFNPFARLFELIIQDEREKVCDDEVMDLGFDRWQYAHALYTLGKSAVAPDTFALAATGQRPLLQERVGRILKVHSQKKAAGGFQIDMLAPVGLFFLCLIVSVFLKKPQRIASTQTAGSSLKITPARVRQLPGDHREANTIIIEKKILATVSQKPMARLKNVSAKGSLAAKKTIQHPIPEPPVPAMPPDEIVNSFVSAKVKTPDFTLILPGIPVPPMLKINADRSLPYVPSSTFYYSNIEKSLQRSGKKTVHL